MSLLASEILVVVGVLVLAAAYSSETTEDEEHVEDIDLVGVQAAKSAKGSKRGGGRRGGGNRGGQPLKPKKSERNKSGGNRKMKEKAKERKPIDFQLNANFTINNSQHPNDGPGLYAVYGDGIYDGYEINDYQDKIYDDGGYDDGDY